MKHQHFEPNNKIRNLINEYEAMCRTGSVGFFDQMAFQQMLDYYERGDQLEKALELVEHALSQHSYSEFFFIRKAQICLIQGKVDQALDACDLAAGLAPNELEIFLLKIEALARSQGTEAFSRAVADALAVCESARERAEVYLTEGSCWEMREDYKRAYRSFRRSLLLNPENELVLDRVWLCVEMCQNYEASVALHRELVERMPYMATVWYNLGHAYFNLGDIEKAVESFEFAVTADEDFEFAFRDAILAYIELENYGRALELCEELMKLVDPESGIYLAMGRCFERMGDKEQAIASYRKAIEMDPQNDLAYYQLGECYFEQEDWPHAIDAYLKALDIDDRKEEYYAAIAEAYFQNEEDAKALHFFEKATEIAPEQAEYWVQLISFMVDINQPAKALKVLDDAGLYANSVELLYCRIAALLRAGKRKEALALLPQALSEQFEQSALLFSLVPEAEADHQLMQLVDMYGGGRGAEY